MSGPSTSSYQVPLHRAVSPCSVARSGLMASRLADLWALTKPGIVSMCALSTGAGLWLSQPGPPLLLAIATLWGACLTVAGANALNMLIERDTDRLMQRTRQRPLAAGRLQPRTALWFGLGCSAAGLWVLAGASGALSALLAALALVTYVLLYTPLKRLSHLALLIGTIPGAMPGLIGSTAASAQFTAPGLVLFATIVLWQLPHVLAIALFRADDYARAGFPVPRDVRGQAALRRWSWLCTLALWPVSLLLRPTAHLGWIYVAAASVAGLHLLLVAVAGGLRSSHGAAGARRFFLATLWYLPVLALGLWLDRMCS